MRIVLIPLMSVLFIVTACGSKKDSGSAGVVANASELKSLEAELNEAFAVSKSTINLKTESCNQTRVTMGYVLRSDNTKGSVKYTELVSKSGDECSFDDRRGIKVFEDESNDICIKSATTSGDIVNISSCDDQKYTYTRSNKTLVISETEDGATMTMTVQAVAADMKGLSPKLKNVKITYFKDDGKNQVSYKTVTGNAIEILKLRL